MYRRLVRSENITLFSPHDGLICTKPSSQTRSCLKSCTIIRSRWFNSQEASTCHWAVLILMQERASTGRIYIANVDHITSMALSFLLLHLFASQTCAWDHSTHSSTGIYRRPERWDRACTLSAFNLGAIRSLESLKEGRSMPLLHWIRYWIIKTIRWGSRSACQSSS